MSQETTTETTPAIPPKKRTGFSPKRIITTAAVVLSPVPYTAMGFLNTTLISSIVPQYIVPGLRTKSNKMLPEPDFRFREPLQLTGNNKPRSPSPTPILPSQNAVPGRERSYRSSKGMGRRGENIIAEGPPPEGYKASWGEEHKIGKITFTRNSSER